MIFASYGRKSVFSEKSDSIKNQHRMNKDYVNFHFSGKVDAFLTYEDEGVTGANTNRPDLKRLMKDVESGTIDVLIVYQLDRLSRDVRDFSNMYAFLEEHHVQFVSVKESIDTTTPIGKAMMYVSVVFAQMERETIANRVLDNMVGLSDDGWWVGGNPPSPYHRKRVTTPDGKQHVIIVPDADEAKKLRDMYNLFLSNKFSLQRFETYLKNNGIKTPGGNFFSTNQLHKMLSMPYCVRATPEIYDYYKDKGCLMSDRSPRDKWDGSVGVMIYGRTTERNKKHELQPPEKWRVCLGRHLPCMDPELWLAVQEQFKSNNFDKSIRYPAPLLKGSLRCSCGRLMCVSRKWRVDGTYSEWYYCPKRMRQGKEYCSMGHIKTDVLDNKVLDIFKQIKKEPAAILNYIKFSPDRRDVKKERANIERNIAIANAKIENLTATLADSKDSAAMKYILQAIERNDKEINMLNRQLTDLQAIERSSRNGELDVIEKQKQISNFIDDFSSFSADEQNAIAKDVIKKCTWDGEKLFILL